VLVHPEVVSARLGSAHSAHHPLQPQRQLRLTARAHPPRNEGVPLLAAFDLGPVKERRQPLRAVMKGVPAGAWLRVVCTHVRVCACARTCVCVCVRVGA